MLVVLFSFLAFDYPQERTISGKITSRDDGSELPGVNVLIKEDQKSTVTDHDGKYSIKVPATGGTLAFSFIGFVFKEIRIDKEDVIHRDGFV